MKPLPMIKAAIFIGILFISGVMGLHQVALAQGSKTFDKPTIDVYRLDWCLYWGKECGKSAANAWCAKQMGKADGYAIAWKQAKDIGASTPTYVLGDNKICNKQFCDGFEWIECGFSID